MLQAPKPYTKQKELQPHERVQLFLCLKRGGLGFAVGAEHVDDFVLVEFLHFVASRTEVFAGVEFGGLLVEDATDGGGHGQTGVRVDVDLADSALGGLTKLLLRDTYSVRKLATVLVDDIDIFLRN